MTEAHYLYGSLDDEYLDLTPEEAYERMECDWTTRPDSFEIIEWTTKPLATLLPDAWNLMDHICEWYIDEECGFEQADEVARTAAKSAPVLAAAEAFLKAFGDEMGTKWLTADKELRRLVVTWDENDQPLLDGRPMYVPRKEIEGQEKIDFDGGAA